MSIIKRVLAGALAGLCCLALTSCARKEQPKTYLIGVSQANMFEPWCVVLSRELREEAAKHPNIQLVFFDAAQDVDKQIKDIGKLMGFRIDLLIVAPCDAAQITPVVREAYKTVPVVMLDRSVEGYDYSIFIGPDNTRIGREAGESVKQMLIATGGNVLEVRGAPDNLMTVERSEGFSRGINGSSAKIIDRIDHAGTSDNAEDKLLLYGEKLREVDVIFAHTDFIALGASRALEKLNMHHIRIVGIDGFSSPNGGIELIKSGRIAQTFTCPTGGREAIQYGLDLLTGQSGVPKRVMLRSHQLTRDNVMAYEQSLQEPIHPLTRPLVMGFSELGTESAWRLAHTKDMQQAAKAFGVDLVYRNGQSSVEQQIQALREFIRMKVDVIVLSPVVETGWDAVLTEAKLAGIKVLLSDRNIQVEDKSLYYSFVGSDFEEEGIRAARWVTEHVTNPDGVNLLEVRGTAGATPMLARQEGFLKHLKGFPAYRVVASLPCDFTQEMGYEVVRTYFANKASEPRIDAIFFHNDDMALGGIKALEELGYAPGKDIKLVSVDATRNAFEAMIAGKLNCTVECSPLMGAQMMKAAKDMMSGIELPVAIITDERVYTQQDAQAVLPTRRY